MPTKTNEVATAPDAAPQAEPDRAGLLARLEAARRALPDAIDLPRSLTERRVNALEKRRAQLDAFIRGLRDVRLSSADDLYATRDELRRLDAILAQQIADAPTLETIPDRRAREREAERQRHLAASATALRKGAKQWPNGAPMIPTILADLLRKSCPTCGHTELRWLGSIRDNEVAIGERERLMAEERARLNSLLAGAAALLAEPELSEQR